VYSPPSTQPSLVDTISGSRRPHAIIFCTLHSSPGSYHLVDFNTKDASHLLIPEYMRRNFANWGTPQINCFQHQLKNLGLTFEPLEKNKIALREPGRPKKSRS
jgi:hypothetical protein